MSVSAYINPDFTWYKKLFFLLITFLLISICILGISAVEKLMVMGHGSKREQDDLYRDRLNDQIQRFMEMIISGTSVMLFSCSYVIVNHICTLVSSGAAGNVPKALTLLTEAWTEGKDFMLLLMIVISCVVNSLIDRFIIPLTRLTKEEKASMRMLGMFYVIVILIYLNTIGDESQYGPVMMYYFGLMVGRFVYFDASFIDFVYNLRNVFFNLPFLLMTLLLTGILGLIGFKMEFFLERNYYIVGIFYTHLFMLTCVFIIYWVFRIINRGKPRENG